MGNIHTQSEAGSRFERFGWQRASRSNGDRVDWFSLRGTSSRQQCLANQLMTRRHCHNVLTQTDRQADRLYYDKLRYNLQFTYVELLIEW